MRSHPARSRMFSMDSPVFASRFILTTKLPVVFHCLNLKPQSSWCLLGNRLSVLFWNFIDVAFCSTLAQLLKFEHKVLPSCSNLLRHNEFVCIIKWFLRIGFWLCATLGNTDDTVLLRKSCRRYYRIPTINNGKRYSINFFQHFLFLFCLSKKNLIAAQTISFFVTAHQ